jgi:hypothetical protein
MLSQARHFIFLHVPRTGGNAIQDYLLPFSEDRKQQGRAQDGVNTFGIVGPITPHKHATLAEYATHIPLSDYRIVMGVRHPLDRALSLYFAPVRVGTQHRLADAPFEIGSFARMLRGMKSMADFLRCSDGKLQRPHLLLRFEQGVETNLERLAEFLGLPPPERLIHLNAGEQEQRAALKEDARVVELVRLRFAEDFQIFGYE